MTLHQIIEVDAACAKLEADNAELLVSEAYAVIAKHGSAT